MRQNTAFNKYSLTKNYVLLALFITTEHTVSIKGGSMNRSKLLVLFIIALVYCVSGFAQSVVEIGTGTTVNKGLPVEPFYGYTYSQTIYTAAQLNQTSPKQITKVAYHFNGGNATTNPSFADHIQIYMLNSNKTAFTSTTDWVGISNFTLCYNDSLYYHGEDEWLEVTLSTPFTYIPGNNLILAVSETNPGYHASDDEFFCSATDDAGVVSIMVKRDASAYDLTAPPAASASGLLAFYPNTKLTLIDPPANPIFTYNPASLAFGNTQVGTTASLNASVGNNGGGSISISNVSITGTDAGLFSLVNVPATPFSLTAGIQVPFQVVFAPTSIGDKTATLNITNDLTRTTIAVPIIGSAYDPTITSFPYTQGFDGTTFPPDGWGNVQVSGSGLFTGATTGTYPTCAPHSGAGMVKFGAYNFQDASAALITPPMNIPTADYHVSFWMYRDPAYPSNDDRIVVYTNSAASIAGADSIAAISRYAESAVTPEGWYQYTFAFPANMVGNGKHVILNAISEYGNNIYIDDFEVAAGAVIVFNPPLNLSAIAGNATVDLAWEAPAARTLTGYKVYRNAAFLADVTAATTYHDATVTNGTTYTYTVTAVYADPAGESPASNPASATPLAPVFNAPANLACTVNGNNVNLTWDAAQGWLNYSADNTGNGIGTNGAATFDVAARFTPTELANCNNASLTKVKFFPRVEAATYTVKVWTGGSMTGNTFTPGTLVSSQAVPTFTNLAWNEVTLTTPVTINAAQELWIGYGIDTPSGYPAGCDAGPAVANKGSLINLNGSWVTLISLSASLNYNWNVAGYALASNGRTVALGNKTVELPAVNPSIYKNNGKLAMEHVDIATNRSLNGYKVYRNSTYLATATTTSYTDANVAAGQYTYYVTASYTNPDGESTPSNTVTANIGAVVFNPPTNLVATAGNAVIDLAWTAPAARPLAGYKVYRNATFLANSTTTTYHDAAVTNGTTYSYYVTATYTNPVGESVPSNTVSATPTAPPVFAAPSDLAATVTGSNVNLTWSAPGQGGPGSYISYDGENNDGIGTGGAATFAVAARFTATELADCNGATLTKVKFFPREATATYTVKVWTGGSVSGTTYNAGTVAATQAVASITNEAWNEVNLATPVTINSAQELWIGYEVVTATGYPAGCDAGPQIEGKGNMMYFNNVWSTLSQIASSLTYNWNIKGFVQQAGSLKAVALPTTVVEAPTIVCNNIGTLKAGNFASKKARSTERPLASYKVYRDGSFLANATATTYADANVAEGAHTYYVTAVYTNPAGESVPSNTVNVTISATSGLDFGFEEATFPPTDWSIVDLDGDTYNWESYAATNAAHTGTLCAASASYDNTVGPLTPDNWLITQQFNVLPVNNDLTFWVAAQDASWPSEHYSVKLSTTGAQPADFTVNLLSETLASGTWTQKTIPLAAYANQNIRIAFEHHAVTDMFMIKLDDVHLPVGTATIDQNNVVTANRLMGNYPNPFNPETTISFDVVKEAPVSIDIYNVKGQKVKTLVNNVMTAGTHTVVWRGDNNEGNKVTSGVYFYKMNTGSYTEIKKMVMMK